MKTNCSLLRLIFPFILFAHFSASGQISISNRSADKVITFGNSKLQIILDYDLKCVVTGMEVNGEPILSDQSGIYSEIRTSNAAYSTRKLAAPPKILTQKDKVMVTGISYGEDKALINEAWTFFITETDIRLSIERTVSKPFVAEEISFPSVNFKSISTWDGAFLDYGGLAWFYLFNEKLCTYGVHSGSSVFWNSTTGNGLSVSASAPGKQVASKFTRSVDDHLLYAVSVSDNELKYRYDADTKRRRFIREKTDVWQPFSLKAGKYTQSVTFSRVDYNREYGRGHLAGINGGQVTSLLNTIARIGVIDARLFGGNSWHTPYGPICLHEQYIAQMGIAINDESYIDGYKECLEHYRDQAVQPDGRVLARWAYTNEDAMPGTATPEGFYEAQWGYLLDSNPDFVSNVSELYQQCGDLSWVKTFKTTCEKALDYMLARDSDGDHLVEMMTGSHTEKRGSDWVDIIWASYENAFVNAKLYYALTLWSDIEKQLGDTEKAGYYSTYASLLKAGFNKSTSDGGFWKENNNWYVHWLDKDHSVHGDNLTIPVNFMAIAYGICDDDERKRAILDRVEEQMQKEKLFFWPLCLYTYAKGEGNDWQFPFPNYENGDLFLSWGAVGVEAYASCKPELALKYIENILARYEKDGLAFQRYGRLKQEGLGDDILSGNSLAIVGLYKSVYGVNPRYNRLYLNPHLPGRLAGTRLNYRFRAEKLVIGLDSGHYSVSNSQFKLASANDFGFSVSPKTLEYFHSDEDSCSLQVRVSGKENLSVEIKNWDEKERAWKQAFSRDKNEIVYLIDGLEAEKDYTIRINDRIYKTIKSSSHGDLEFDLKVNANPSVISLR
ncbi:MAG: hypothetical protein AAGU19_16435 [Prolixibacteraceae bacterium]